MTTTPEKQNASRFAEILTIFDRGNVRNKQNMYQFRDEDIEDIRQFLISGLPSAAASEGTIRAMGEEERNRYYRRHLHMEAQCSRSHAEVLGLRAEVTKLNAALRRRSKTIERLKSDTLSPVAASEQPGVGLEKSLYAVFSKRNAAEIMTYLNYLLLDNNAIMPSELFERSKLSPAAAKDKRIADLENALMQIARAIVKKDNGVNDTIWISDCNPIGDFIGGMLDKEIDFNALYDEVNSPPGERGRK